MPPPPSLSVFSLYYGAPSDDDKTFCTGLSTFAHLPSCLYSLTVTETTFVQKLDITTMFFCIQLQPFSLCSTMLALVRLKRSYTRFHSPLHDWVKIVLKASSPSPPPPPPLLLLVYSSSSPCFVMSIAESQPQASADQSGWQWTTCSQLIWRQTETSAVFCFLPQRVTGQTRPSTPHELHA